MVYSVNQVRQFYVIDSSADLVEGKDGTVTFKVKDNSGKTVCTDNINLKKVEWVHLTSADAQKGKLKAVTVTLSNDAFPNGKTIPGLDYILKINFRQLFGMSDEDIYQKFGAVHGTKSMTKAGFIVRMIQSLMKNFKRELGHWLDFKINNTIVSDVKIVTETIDGQLIPVLEAINAAGTKILHEKESGATAFTIEAASQADEWILGTKKLEHIQFDVHPSTVVDDDSNYDEIVWAETTDSVVAGESNYYQIADMEYFYHGYRGDQYRMKGWPDVINTKYLVTPGTSNTNVTNGYDVLDIQYYYSGDNEDSLHAAKTLTLVAPKGDTTLAGLAEDFCNAVGCKGKKVTADSVTTIVSDESDDSN